MGLEGCLSPSDSISHNCRVGWVGRHHWRSSSPTALAPAGSPWACHSEMSPGDFWIPPQKDSATSLQPVPMSMRREDKGLLSSINYSALKDRVTLFCCCQSHILLFSHLLDSYWVHEYATLLSFFASMLTSKDLLSRRQEPPLLHFLFTEKGLRPGFASVLFVHLEKYTQKVTFRGVSSNLVFPQTSRKTQCRMGDLYSNSNFSRAA